MLILGIDDAGRGPVIGPMVLAGVLINKSTEKEFSKLGIKDSKLLSPKKRRILSEEIKKLSISSYEVLISVSEIDNKDNENLSLLIVTEKGYGKKTGIKEYKVQKRGGSGILTYSVTAKTGKVSATKIIDGSMKNDLLIVSNEGKVIRLPERQVPKLGRATLGVRLINLSGNDTVSALAYLAEDLEDSQNGK